MARSRGVSEPAAIGLRASGVQLAEADLVFVDPDNGLEPAGYRPTSSKAGKSILLCELHDLSKPGRCLIVYHHHTRREGGHRAEIEFWAERLGSRGFGAVDALRARPFSPRVFFLLNASPDIRQRAEQIASDWHGLITWHPGAASRGSEGIDERDCDQPALASTYFTPACPAAITAPNASLTIKSARSRSGATTRVGNVNRNGQEVIRPTGVAGTDHGQYVYVLHCKGCGHEYGANGSDIWLRRCPACDRGAPGLQT